MCIVTIHFTSMPSIANLCPDHPFHYRPSALSLYQVTFGYGDLQSVIAKVSRNSHCPPQQWCSYHSHTHWLLEEQTSYIPGLGIYHLDLQWQWNFRIGFSNTVTELHLAPSNMISAIDHPQIVTDYIEGRVTIPAPPTSGSIICSQSPTSAP